MVWSDFQGVLKEGVEGGLAEQGWVEVGVCWVSAGERPWAFPLEET